MPDSENKPPVDPEQLLKMLDIELAMKRQQRLERETSRQTFRIVGLLVIVGSALAAVIVLYFLMSQLQRPSGNETDPVREHVTK